jgi:cytochrome c oxidase cbb3-type subunit 3
MPGFGKDGLLERSEIITVANYVRSLAGLSVRAGTDLAVGRKIFADKCATCHSENGKGNQEVGAPDLTDRIWLYGPEEATIMDVITSGRTGVMPAWVDRLDPVAIKSLSVYVHTLGGGK